MICQVNHTQVQVSEESAREAEILPGTDNRGGVGRVERSLRMTLGLG